MKHLTFPVTPPKWTNVPWTGIILKRSFISQSSILCMDMLVLRGVYLARIATYCNTNSKTLVHPALHREICVCWRSSWFRRLKWRGRYQFLVICWNWYFILSTIRFNSSPYFKWTSPFENIFSLKTELFPTNKTWAKDATLEVLKGSTEVFVLFWCLNVGEGSLLNLHQLDNFLSQK